MTGFSRGRIGAAALGCVVALAFAACRNPVPPPRDQPGTKPSPDAGLPGTEEPNIEPDTGNPLGPGGGVPAPLPNAPE